jgi:hypothetical protein
MANDDIVIPVHAIVDVAGTKVPVHEDGSLVISEVRNAKATNANHTEFVVDINHPIHGWIPYGLTDHDTCNVVNNDKLREMIGSNFIPYTPPTQAELDEEQATKMRDERRSLLSAWVDPVVSNPLMWGDLSPEQQNKIATYRRTLLDMPNQEGWPWNVVWPDPPEL